MTQPFDLGTLEIISDPGTAEALARRRAHMIAWLRDDFARGTSSLGCALAADELERLMKNNPTEPKQ